MVSHSTEQRHDCIEKPKSISILFCSPWRSFQSPHVPFELEWFWFFPLTTRSRVHQTERFFQCVEGKRAPSDSITFSLSSSCFCLHYLCVLVYCLESVQFYALLCLICFCLFSFQFWFILFFIKIKLKNWKIKKYKKSVCFVYIVTCVPWMAIETKFSKLCIFGSLDEHLYAQLSKWVLWLVFVMNKIKLSLVLNICITLFDRKD